MTRTASNTFSTTRVETGGMFHRRLAIILALVVLGLAPLALQTLRLTTLRHDESLDEARSKLLRTRWHNTTRGRILDRTGRVLAHDEPGYAIAIDYDVITGAWAEAQAGKDARKLHADEWPKLSRVQRQELIEARLPELRAHLDRMWQQIAERTGTAPDELAERRDRIVGRVSGRFEHLVDVRLQIEIDRRLRLGEEITTEIEQQLLEKASRPIREQTQAHIVVPRIPDAVGFEFRKLADTEIEREEPLKPLPLMPGLEIPDAGRRIQPHATMGVQIDRSTLPAPIRTNEPIWIESTGVASHLLGWTRDRLYAEDVQAREQAFDTTPALGGALADTAARAIDRGQYFPGDRIGAAGLEQTFEHTLRGWRGLEITRLDTGEISTITPDTGRDITLTIDAQLQARVQALLSPELGLARVQPWHHNQSLPLGSHLFGAAVVIDVKTADILAMVSTPTFTREIFSDKRALEDPIKRPLINRALEAPYPPGSIVKPIMLPEAVKRGLAEPDLRIECTGHLLPNRPNLYRCWIYKRFGITHQPEEYTEVGLAFDEAIKGSCNIYFYELGRRLAQEGITAAYTDFHVGRPWAMPVPTAFEGALGRPDMNGKLEPNETIFMGMGQGPIAWTPLHAANAYATLARNGVEIEPRLIAGSPRTPRDIGLDPTSLRAALKGLSRVVNDTDGTGHGLRTEQGREPIFNAPGIRVWGKTGTAEAPSIVKDGTVLRAGDHAWFVALVAPETAQTPTHAIAVVMDYAGSGGRVSGPIANQIVHALIAEGYLPRASSEAGASP